MSFGQGSSITKKCPMMTLLGVGLYHYTLGVTKVKGGTNEEIPLCGGVHFTRQSDMQAL